MNRNQHIDKKLRELEYGQQTTPPATAWQGIENKINIKNSGRKYIFIFSIFAITTAAAVLNHFTSFNIQDQASITDFKNSTALVTINEAEHSLLASQKDTPLHENSTDTATKINNVARKIVNTSTSRLKTATSNQKDSPLNYLTTPKHFSQTIQEITKTGNKLVFDTINTVTINKNKTKSEVYTSGFQKKIEEETTLISKTNQTSIVHKRRRKSTGYFIEIGGVMGSHRKQFTPETSNTNLRQETEKEWYTWGAYIGAGLKFTDNFYGSAQLNWTQQKDKFSIKRENISKIIIEDDKSGSQTVSTKTGTWISEGEINYNTLNGVVLLGYQFLDEKKSEIFNLGLESGMMYNMKLNTKGKIAIDDYTVSKVEDENIYKTNLGIGVTAQLVAQINLTDKMSLLVKPYFNTYFNNWNKITYDSEMRTNNFGTLIAIKRSL